jgi:hypothetical protein
LALQLTNLGETLPAMPVAFGDLSDYAMTLRYEETARLPTPLDRQACIQTVQLLRAHVIARIQALNPNPPPSASSSTVTP